MEGREGGRKDGRKEGGHSHPNLALSVSYCNSYQICIISAIYFLVSHWMPSVDYKPHESRFHFHCVTYEFSKRLYKYLESGQQYIPHFVRIMSLCCWLLLLFFKGAMLTFTSTPLIGTQRTFCYDA